MKVAFELIFGFAIIAALIAAQLLALYLISRVVLIAVSFVPMIGRKHRHKDWDTINRRQTASGTSQEERREQGGANHP